MGTKILVIILAVMMMVGSVYAGVVLEGVELGKTENVAP